MRFLPSPSFPMTRSRRSTLLVAALAALVAMPALAQSARTAPDASAQIARATAGLDLSADQRAQLDAVASRYATPAPGDSWRLAADVARVLTPAQIQQMQAAPAQRRAERTSDAPRARRAEGLQADRPRGMRPEGARRADAPAVREAMRPQAEALRALLERRRSGAITEAEFTAERDRLRAAMEASLTPEQRAARDERQARGRAEREARAAVLGLTADQETAVREQMRGAMRPADRDAVDPAARRAQIAEMRTRLESIYTPEQRAVMAVHRALMSGPRGMRMHDGARRGDAGARSPRTRMTDR